MTDIVVVRFLGDKEGDDIVDELLTTDLVALSRGRAELDSRATAFVERSIRVPYQAGLETGQICEITDELQGETYVAKIIGLSYANDLAEALVTIDLLAPTDFYT